MCWCFLGRIKTLPNMTDDSLLTDKEQAYIMKMVGLTDKNTPFNEEFFYKMNKVQVKFLMSKVDMQDCQYSYEYSKYVSKLQALSKRLESA